MFVVYDTENGAEWDSFEHLWEALKLIDELNRDADYDHFGYRFEPER